VFCTENDVDFPELTLCTKRRFSVKAAYRPSRRFLVRWLNRLHRRPLVGRGRQTFPDLGRFPPLCSASSPDHLSASAGHCERTSSLLGIETLPVISRLPRPCCAASRERQLVIFDWQPGCREQAGRKRSETHPTCLRGRSRPADGAIMTGALLAGNGVFDVSAPLSFTSSAGRARPRRPALMGFARRLSKNLPSPGSASV
jgi:hypothetical protein